MSAAKPLREQHKDYTRELIFQTFAEMVTEDGLTDVSIQQVADRAGVTHRTVYRHFASRQQLVDQLAQRLGQRMVERGGLSMPASADDLPAAAERNYRVFDEAAELVKPLVLLTWGARAPMESQKERTRALAEALAPLARDLDPVEARGIVALFRYLVSSRTWLIFRDEFGLEGKDIGPLLRWVLRTLLDALPDRNTQIRNELDSRSAIFMADRL